MSACDGEALLAGWLQRLVALLAGAGGAAARQLLATVVDRSADLWLDDTRLTLYGRRTDAGDLEVRIAPVTGTGNEAAHVHTRSDVLRMVMDGHALLDTVIADGRLEIRADLLDLLAFHELVMLTLALAPRLAGLRALWAEFDATWPRGAARCATLEAPHACHGELLTTVPADVQQGRSPPTEGP